MQQVLQEPAPQNMLGDNLPGIFRLQAAVNHPFGIDNERGAQLTIADTAGLQDSHFFFQPVFVQLLLYRLFDLPALQ